MAQLSPGPKWRKSRRSSISGDNCVEVAGLGKGRVGVRDSKSPTSTLTLSAAGWRRLAVAIRTERYEV